MLSTTFQNIHTNYEHTMTTFFVKTGINLLLTIYPRTLRGIRGYKVIPEVAAYTQSR